MDHPDLFSVPLFLANLLNQDPFKTHSKLKHVWAMLYWFCILFNTSLCVYTVIVIDVDNATDAANIVVTCISFFHGLGKLIQLFYMKEKFGQIILKNRELKFIYENIPFDVEEDIQWWLKYTMLFCKLYCYIGVSLTFTYYLKALMYHQLPMPLIIPDHPFLPFRFVLLTQMIFMIIVIFIFINDMMVIISFVYVITFYKALHSKIAIINLDSNSENADENVRKLFDLFEDHLRIIEYMKFLQRKLSHIFGLQLIITLASATTQLYLLKTSGYAAEQLVQSIVYGILVIGELGCYCFPIDLAMTEASKTSNYFYNLNWYNGQYKIAKDLIVVINYAQSPVEFTASGLVQISNSTFIMVCRFIISVYTLMNSIVSRNKKS